MHECPECGQACDCDNEDTWFDSPVDCLHDCEDLDSLEDPDDDYELFELAGYEPEPPTLMQKIKRWLIDHLPYRCDVCQKWTMNKKFRPCCSEKCSWNWVPF